MLLNGNKNRFKNKMEDMEDCGISGNYNHHIGLHKKLVILKYEIQ